MPLYPRLYVPLEQRLSYLIQHWFSPENIGFGRLHRAIGRVAVESARVRLCSGDGKCACEELPPGGYFFQAGVVAPPEGSISETPAA